jgi:DNA repair protein RadD
MYKPRYYQEECEYAIFDYFEHNSGNPVCALPTGTGKSIIIANFIKKVFSLFPTQRIMMLTHVKELIEQNASKLRAVWTTAPIGIHSASLKARGTILPVIFGGVQSVSNTVKKAIKNEIRHFGHIDLIIIDECHLVSPKEDSTYQMVINELLKINPFLKVIGFTATPYRMKDGMLTDDDSMFTDICYDITGVESFNRLIAEGFLAPLIPKRTSKQIDVTGVGMVDGDFNKKQVAEVSNIQQFTFDAINESLQLGYDRNSIMVFASNIQHCEDIHDMFTSMGIDSVFVHSKIKKHERDERLNAFKTNQVSVVIGHGILTTGFDHPPLDMIIDLAPTASPGRHVQKYGRGTRPYNCNDPSQYIPGFDYVKQNCLVLDFAGNTKRLGPINDPVKPRKPGKGGGDAPIRLCNECGMYNHASARVCELCGTEFTFETKISSTAGTEEMLKLEEPVVEFFNVQTVLYKKHNKKDKKPSLRVCYICGLQKFDEWICLEHSGYVAKRAQDWWRQRIGEEPPSTVDEALKKVSQLAVPNKIRVHVNKQYPEILSAEW